MSQLRSCVTVLDLVACALINNAPLGHAGSASGSLLHGPRQKKKGGGGYLYSYVTLHLCNKTVYPGAHAAVLY